MKTQTSNTPDIVIIGAGPIGIELAVALKKAGFDLLHFEKGQVAHTMTWFPRMMRFFSSPDRIAIAGVPIPRTDQSKCTVEEYIAYLRSVVLQFDLNIRAYEPVKEISPESGGGFRLYTNHFGAENLYHADKIIFAVGGMHHPRMLNIAGENLPNVSHYFIDPHPYFMQKLLIVGGKNSAIEAAIRCSRAGAHVSLSYRRSEFSPKSVKYWLLPELEGMIRREELRFYPETTPRTIGFEYVTLEKIPTGELFEIENDFVLMLTGYCADLSLLREAGVQLTGNTESPEYNEMTMETNVPGIYVAGTAVAGTQDSYKTFIENCHIHVERIAAALTGKKPPEEPDTFQQPES